MTVHIFSQEELLAHSRIKNANRLEKIQAIKDRFVKIVMPSQTKPNCDSITVLENLTTLEKTISSRDPD
jgi:hypothetical protein